jgi:hypothetical protein
MGLFGAFTGRTEISNLEVSCLQAQLYPDQVHQPAYTIYNDKTCVKFHKLLVATLLAYANALTKLNSTSCHNSQNHASAGYVMSVFNFARLLLLIADSWALQLHLAILERAQHLPAPKLADFSCYSLFAQSFNLVYQPLMRNTGGSETAGTEEDEDVAAVDDPASKGRMDFVTFYWGRIHKQAAHFGALQILEGYCRMRSDTFANLQVPLIAVKLNQSKSSWSELCSNYKEWSLECYLRWMKIQLK